MQTIQIDPGQMRAEQLVATRREGKHIHHRATSPRATAVMQLLYEQFCQGGAQTNHS